MTQKNGSRNNTAIITKNYLNNFKKDKDMFIDAYLI